MPGPRSQIRKRSRSTPRAPTAQPILALNAFDSNRVGALEGELGALMARRVSTFGPISMLFYDRPLNFVRGEGVRMYDAAGTPYLDVYNNVPSVGHSHPHVVKAIARQAALLNIHTRYLHEGVLAYAERLLATLPDPISNIAFTCTGSESNDLALRVASAATGGSGFIVTTSAYHGNSAAVTGISPSSWPGKAAPPHVRMIPPPDGRLADDAGRQFAANVKAAIDSLEESGIRFAALIFDSIFSSDGVYADPPGFLAPAVAAARQAGGLVIADEVQPGFGRTGSHMWGFQRHGIAPDIVTMGKPMGNGYPMGAAAASPELFRAFTSSVGYFNTFGGSPVAAAAGAAVLDVLEGEGLLANAERVGAYLLGGLRELAGRHDRIADVRGAGLFVGLEFHRPRGGKGNADTATFVINALRDRRILIGAAGPHGSVLKIRPPLCFGTEHADLLVTALDEALR